MRVREVERKRGREKERSSEREVERERGTVIQLIDRLAQRRSIASTLEEHVVVTSMWIYIREYFKKRGY